MHDIAELRANQNSLLVRYNIMSFPELRTNFWGITKNGNLSIKAALKAHGPGSFISRVDALRTNYFNFSVIREPIDRFRSMYKYNLTRPDLCYLESSLDVDALLSLIENTDDKNRNVHFRSQCYFVAPKGTVVPTLFLLEHDLTKIENLFNVSVGITNNIDLKIDLSESQIARVKDIYAEDILLYNTTLEARNDQSRV